MKARLSLEGDVTILEISGYLDYDSTVPLQQSLEKLYAANQNIKLIIDMKSLEFVGSTGVSMFVKSLSQFNKMKIKPHYFGVKSEFVKLFKAFEEAQPFEVKDNKESAIQASFERLQNWQIQNPASSRTH